MHSRIFVITYDINDFNDYLEYEDIIRVAPGVDFYGDSDIGDDVGWLSHEMERVTGNSNPIQKEGNYYTVDSALLLGYLEKGFRNRLSEAEKIIKKLKKPDNDSLDLWRLNMVVSPDYSFLFYYENCLYNENELFFELRDTAGDSKLYIVKTYDYHF